MTPFEFTVVSLAAARVWWLLGRDTLTAPLRDRLPPGVAYWVECPFCSGFHVAVAAVAAWHLGVWPVVFEVFAAAMAATLVAQLTARLTD
jgi:hypothetical protein